ncbi:MAG: Cold-shock DNA-binding domain [Bacteroidota bacterium]|jgi:ribosomal protein S1
MDTNQEHIGHVTRFFKERDFGFIKNEDGEEYFFFRDKEKLKQKKQAGLIPYIHCYSAGDRVSFKLRNSQREEGKIEAYDVVFMTNEKKELLVSEFENNSVLEGYIKVIHGDKLFVKHSITGIDLPISISVWEENLDQVYWGRVNQLVRFKLKQVGRFDKLTAILTDVQLIPEYYELTSHYSNQTHAQGKITGINKNGVHVALCQGKVNGFIFFSKNPELDAQNDQLKQLQKGEFVDVWVKYPLKETNLQVALALHELNLE